MNQCSLDFTARARATDPGSSHRAAAKMNRTGRTAKQCNEVLALLVSTPGLTSKELAARHGVDRYMTARRLSDLLKANKVTRIKPAKGDVRWWAI